MAAFRIATRITNHHHHFLNKNYNHHYRSIFTTLHLQNSWINKVKNVFTPQKPEQPPQVDASQFPSGSFTLLNFADEMKKARKIGAFKEYMVGRSSEVTFATAFEKYEAIIRYLAAFDYTGENLKTSHKQEAAKHCNCTIADVENALAKFTWAKEAQKKIQELNKEGKPMPKNIAELQKLVGTNPLDLARSNLAKSGQVSRNAPCPCGSKKRYKRCCGKD
ncbi:unnamed protein product [Lathyrus sativus]|nr:unnamed protein product [Lathyrus sativus]